MNVSNLNRKNISCHIDTYERLGSYGGMNDSYSDMIDAIINFAESKGLTYVTLKEFRSKGK